MLVRFVAASLLGITLVELALYWIECSEPRHPVPLQVWPCILKSIPAVIGVAILVKARAIAEWVSNLFDQ